MNAAGTIPGRGEAALHRRFLACAAHWGDRPALLVKRDGGYQPITWTETAAGVRSLAMGLSALGVVQGERVALLSENRPEWLVADIAILSEGAVTVPIYPTSTPSQVGYILKDAGVRVVLVSTAAQARKVLEAAGDLEMDVTVVCMDQAGEAGVRSLEEVRREGADLERGNPGLFERHAARAGRDDTATIIYTSGTTGEPKGVMLSHGNILFNCDAADCVVPVSEADTCLSFLPLSHVLERTVGQYFMLFHGVTVAYAEGIDTVAENMREVRPTLMISVPRLFEKMHARVLEAVRSGPALRRRIFFWGIDVGRRLTPARLRGEAGPLELRLQYTVADRLVFSKIRARLGGRLRYFVSGGAPLSREIAEFFYAAGVTIVEGYGLTESAPVIAANRHDRIKFGTVGPPLEGVEVRIADDGEILTRSPSVMQGYYHNEEATREVVDAEGWLHTGDVGFLDEEGFLTITDRKKDIIVTSGGKNVAPQYIENLLVTDKYIAQAMVYGDRRNYLTALVVPDFAALAEAVRSLGVPGRGPADWIADPRIRDFLMERVRVRSRDLARFEQVKKIALLDREWTAEAGELTPTLKVRRKTVTRKYLPMLEALYTEE